ncbi:MAG: hypothetical protein ABFD97_20840 [Syntrophobacter sp.]
MKIDVKYCGGCNPRIDRAQIVRELEDRLRGRIEVITGRPSREWEIGILMCGCTSACVDRPEITGEAAGTCILVSGAMVDLQPVAEAEIADRVAEMLIRLKNV